MDYISKNNLKQAGLTLAKYMELNGHYGESKALELIKEAIAHHKTIILYYEDEQALMDDELSYKLE